MKGVESLSNDQIRVALGPFGFAPDQELCGAIRIYLDLLLRWNRRVSLTTVTEPEDVLQFHFGESIAAISAVPIEQGRLADVGSGAGFPGVPLALFAPDLNVTLIESNARKAAFLSELQRELKIPGLDVFRGRAKDLPPSNTFDFIAARAVGKYDELVSWSPQVLNPSGQIVLWLGENETSEVAAIPGWRWRSPQKIAGSKRRFLLAGELSS